MRPALFVVAFCNKSFAATQTKTQQQPVIAQFSFMAWDMLSQSENVK